MNKQLPLKFRKNLNWLVILLALWVMVRVCLIILELSGDVSVDRLVQANSWFNNQSIHQGRSLKSDMVLLLFNNFIKIGYALLLIRYRVLHKIHDFFYNRYFTGLWLPELLTCVAFLLFWFGPIIMIFWFIPMSPSGSTAIHLYSTGLPGSGISSRCPLPALDRSAD